MPDGRATENLPLSLTLITMVSVLAMAVDGGVPGPSAWTGARPATGLSGAGGAREGAAVEHARPEPAREQASATVRRHAALVLLLRLADPALASRVEPLADPAAALTPSEVARLRRILARAGASAEAFLRERAQLAQDPARRAGLVAVLDEWHADAPGR